MADNLKDTWKNTGVGLGHAFRDLGKTLIKSGATAVKKADKWANGDDEKEAEKPSEEAAAEDSAE